MFAQMRELRLVNPTGQVYFKSIVCNCENAIDILKKYNVFNCHN